MPVWLFALLGAAFVFYTDDYVIAGILPELARDLGVSEAAAGQLVTVFSVTVAVGAPAAAVALARQPRRWLFAAALVVFCAANLGAALAPSFAVLMVLRVVAALSAAAATPALFAFAARHAPPERTGRFLAVVSLGVTGSIAAGVPVGTWIGGLWGWRATFLAMALAGVLALVALLAALPREQGPEEAPATREQLRILRQPAVVWGLLANCTLMTGSMMMLTYLAPYLAETAGAGVQGRAVAFGLSGAAGIAGIWLGGMATDRWGADRSLTLGIGTIVATMLALWLLWSLRPAALPVVLVVTTLWGAMAFFNAPVIQARLHELAGPVSGQALALNTSGTYLGVAGGAAIGGVVISAAGPGALPPVAAAWALVAWGLVELARRSRRPLATT